MRHIRMKGKIKFLLIISEHHFIISGELDELSNKKLLSMAGAQRIKSECVIIAVV